MFGKKKEEKAEDPKNNYPKLAKKKVTLSTGRIVLFREPRMEDQLMASKLVEDGVVKNPFKYQYEFFNLVILQVRRANGEIIHREPGDHYFGKDGVFSYKEGLEILANSDKILEGVDEDTLKKTKIENL